MAKPGPDPLPKSKKRTKRVSVMVTDAEYRRYRKRAGPGKNDISEWLRELAEKDLKKAK